MFEMPGCANCPSLQYDFYAWRQLGSYVLQMPGLSASCLAAKGRGQFTTLKAEDEARKAATATDKEEIQATSEY